MSFDKICQKVAKTLNLKNKMYGNSFEKTYEEYGKAIFCVRLEDKLNRLKQMVLNGLNADNTDEKIEDTLLDIAGYAVLALSVLENGREEE